MEKNRYHGMSEEKKRRLKQYQKNYCEAKKSQSKLIYFIDLVMQTCINKILIMHE